MEEIRASAAQIIEKSPSLSSARDEESSKFGYEKTRSSENRESAESDEEGYASYESGFESDDGERDTRKPRRSEFHAAPNFQRKMDLAGSVTSIADSAASVQEYLAATSPEERMEHIFRMCEDRIAHASKEIDNIYANKIKQLRLAESEKTMRDTWGPPKKKRIPKGSRRKPKPKRSPVKRETQAIYASARPQSRS